MDPGPLPPTPEYDPRTGLTSDTGRNTTPRVLATTLAVLLLLGAAAEGSLLLAGCAVLLVALTWGGPPLWRRLRRGR